MPVKIDIDYQKTQHNYEQEDMLELCVRDYGPGIPDDMINVLFEPYATNKARGTGLGLAIVKKIIDEHHGAIWVENRQPGASIQIKLPIARASL
jgi:nitrogen fixation/metabolism regulation signal transduction histidine kinase